MVKSTRKTSKPNSARFVSPPTNSTSHSKNAPSPSSITSTSGQWLTKCRWYNTTSFPPVKKRSKNRNIKENTIEDISDDDSVQFNFAITPTLIPNKKQVQKTTRRCSGCTKVKRYCMEALYGPFLLESSKAFFKNNHEDKSYFEKCSGHFLNSYRCLYSKEYYEQHTTVPPLAEFELLPVCVKRGSYQQFRDWMREEKRRNVKEELNRKSTRFN